MEAAIGIEPMHKGFCSLKKGVFVWSPEQFERTYPETVQANIKYFRTGSAYSESYLAHAGISNACSGRQNSLLPKDAKP